MRVARLYFCFLLYAACPALPPLYKVSELTMLKMRIQTLYVSDPLSAVLCALYFYVSAISCDTVCYMNDASFSVMSDAKTLHLALQD